MELLPPRKMAFASSVLPSLWLFDPIQRQFSITASFEPFEHVSDDMTVAGKPMSFNVDKIAKHMQSGDSSGFWQPSG